MNRQTPPNFTVIGLCGSLREGSYTRLAVEAALRGAAAEGARAETVDLRALNLPFCDGRDDDATYPAGVATLRERVKAAHGVILGTPEYHGSFSGVLKNALDLMGFEEFEGKLVGLVGVAAGHMGGYGALNALRDIGRSLHAWVVPEQAIVPSAWKAFGADGRLQDPKLEERLLTIGRQVARFACLHASDKAAFVQTFEESTENPGG